MRFPFILSSLAVLDMSECLISAVLQCVVARAFDFPHNSLFHFSGFYCFQMLSRAFRNRFVELHFDEIPAPELEIILHKRCDMPLSYCKKMVSVMTDLQVSSVRMVISNTLQIYELYNFIIF